MGPYFVAHPQYLLSPEYEYPPGHLYMYTDSSNHRTTQQHNTYTSHDYTLHRNEQNRSADLHWWFSFSISPLSPRSLLQRHKIIRYRDNNEHKLLLFIYGIFFYNRGFANFGKFLSDEAFYPVCQFHWFGFCATISSENLSTFVLQESMTQYTCRVCCGVLLFSENIIRSRWVKKGHILSHFPFSAFFHLIDVKGSWPYFGPDLIHFIFYSIWTGIIEQSNSKVWADIMQRF